MSADPVSIDAVAAVEATSAKLRRIRTELGEEVFTLAALIDNRFAWGPSDPDAAVEVAREALAALRSAGWLRTAEDRAVLDRLADDRRHLPWHDRRGGDFINGWRAALDWVESGDTACTLHATCLAMTHHDPQCYAYLAVVRARRVAAGGTEAQP